MPKPNWTQDQLDAINARGGTVLVSAAAGSGKTAVLVNRAVERILDPENPCDADRLLVVTFTKAAAAEMRGRLESAISERIRLEPGNMRIKRQQILLSGANISTVDSFCAKLARENFQLLNISGNFSIIADKQQEEMMNEAVTRTIDEIFASGNYGLADIFSSERNDKKLSDTILSLYDFTQSHLYPSEWLESKIELYDSEIPAENSVWGRKLLSSAADKLNYSLHILMDGIRQMQDDQKLADALQPVFSEDLAAADALLKDVNAADWDGLVHRLGTVQFSKFPTVHGYAEDPLKIRLQTIRDNVKSVTGELKKEFAYVRKDVAKDIGRLKPVAEALSKAVIRFSEIYDSMKKEKNLADYSDIEHYAVSLFLEKREDGVYPTDFALEYSERFDEIMIDEYQDTNEVQDSIFRAISKNDRNRFMVGDVKQSIYSFRQAMPEIFLSYKKAFREYDRSEDSYPASISLGENFRSGEDVINSVNFIFSTLMSEKVGGIDYSGDEMLKLGRDFPVKSGNETVIKFVERDAAQSMEQQEAATIAEMIRKMVDEGYELENGKKASYKDFCILLRSANKYAASYAEQLSARGVPAWANVTGGFFSAYEVLLAVSFLKIIDNPDQDIALLSVLMSPLYGFTADEMAELRKNDRQDSLYTALLRASSENEKYASFLENIAEYRVLASVMSCEDFLNYFYGKSGYTELVLAMEDGENRLANLRLLMKYAVEYGKSGYASVSEFIRFVSRLMDNRSDMEAANTISENADVVKIMSIHKSKGLEFPVCILAGCGRLFNSERSDAVLNFDLGFASKLPDSVNGARYDNIVRQAINEENKLNSISEEMRILYVALTRARQKLIVLSTVSNCIKKLSAAASRMSEEIPPFTVSDISSLSEWIMICALRHPDGRVLRDTVNADPGICCLENYSPWQISVETSPFEKAEEHLYELRALPDENLKEELLKRLNYVYPYAELNQIPAKVTASAVSEEMSGNEESLERPSFLSYKGLTPAERGIALHSYLQYADFARALKDPEAEKIRLVSEGYITKEQGEAVNMNRVKAFLSGDLGKRIAAGSRVRKEERFNARIPASRVMPELSGEYADTDVILQGAVDCSFVEDDKLYIVDFKTDRVESEAELAERYGIQLKLYMEALTKISGIEAGECYLYSLHMNKEIKIV